jgi:hypothetical protein
MATTRVCTHFTAKLYVLYIIDIFRGLASDVILACVEAQAGIGL